MARLFWITFIAAGALYAVMAVWSGPYLMTEADGLRMFDMRPLGYSQAEARAYLDALSEEGRVFYLTVQQRLDLVYPALLALSFVAGFVWLARGLLRWVLIALAVVGAAGDYMENLLVAGMLRADHVPGGMVAQASLATMVKSGAVTLCFVALLGLGLRALWRRWR